MVAPHRRPSPRLNRRKWLQNGSLWLAAAGLAGSSGCISAVAQGAEPDLVWGRRGISDGRFLKPRAMAIDRHDRLFIVDTTGRIQVFDADGTFLYKWSMPETEFGRPTGLAVDHWQAASDDDGDSRLLVADTHYHRMTVFDLTGQILLEKRIGGSAGFAPGEFAFVTDAIRDSQGNYYVGEYGDSDRIQKFDPQGQFMTQWGGTGETPGLFVRPQSLVMDDDDVLWIADACNHRIQAFDCTLEQPQLVALWGERGHSLGELYFPYDLAVGGDGAILVCEYGNQRLQRFDREGRFLGAWGSPGHDPGRLYQPWGVVIDSQDRVHVLDSNNHRVQRLSMSGW
ncbi:NHL repeat protein [Roseimaritima ulvae]|uniref:NHL repeat protein n=1 Tax=Roseimaritima ulvae TaxID=980254 RepID=A0A5B9QQW1_9BACT|nr:NHL repeat-containing protein [Roseimaritima ulvae]QEG40299.1 NHL repeat protein [Roseimaritima ulvae]